MSLMPFEQPLTETRMVNTPARGVAVRRLVFPVSLALIVSGCGLFPDRSMEYQTEQYGEPPRMPEDMPRQSFNERFPIPDLVGVNEAPEGGDFEIPRPPDLTGDILADNYQVEESGDQTWLLINEVPGRVWPAVSAFLNNRGVGTALEEPREGLRQTGVLNNSQRAREWLELTDEDDEQDLVMQFRVGHGVRARSTEVQVRIHEVDSEPSGLLEWRDEPGQPERESEVLNDLAEFLRETEDTATYSRVALNLPRDERVGEIQEEAGKEYLPLELGFDRGWSEVSRGLSNLEVPVVDVNRSEGLWYVDGREASERTRGWWFWRREVEPEHNHEVRLERHGEQLRVFIEREADYDGEDRSEELLRDLRENLR